MRHPLMDHIIQEHGPIMGNRVNQRRLPITVKVFLGRRIHDQSERAVCRPAAAIRIQPQPQFQPQQPYVPRPVAPLRTQRGLLKYVLLGLVTFSIYDIWQMSEVGDSLNLLAFKRDGKHTMHYCLMFFLVGWSRWASAGWCGITAYPAASAKNRPRAVCPSRSPPRHSGCGHPRLAHRSGTVHLYIQAAARDE